MNKSLNRQTNTTIKSSSFAKNEESKGVSSSQVSMSQQEQEDAIKKVLLEKVREQEQSDKYSQIFDQNNKKDREDESRQDGSESPEDIQKYLAETKLKYQLQKEVQKKNAPIRKYNWHRLGEKEREDIFLKLNEENNNLKRERAEQDNKIKVLTTQLHVIEKEYAYIQKGTSGEKINKDNLIQLENLKKENNQLKHQIEVLQQVNKIQNSKKLIQKQIKPRENTDIQENKQQEISIGNQANKLSDMIRLVDMLKKQLKESEEQNKKLQQLMNSKLIVPKETEQKNVQLATLRARYEEIASHFESQKNMLDQTRTKVVELNMQLRDERDKTLQLQTQCNSLEVQVKALDTMESEMQTLRQEKITLEMRLRELSQQPFFQEFGEKATTKVKLKQLEVEHAQSLAVIESLKTQNVRMDAELAHIKKELTQTQKSLSEKQLEAAELRQLIESQNSKLNLFKDMPELDNDNYMKALGVVKWKGEEPVWRNLTSIDRKKRAAGLGKATDRLAYLETEIEHLILEKGELAAHLEKTRQVIQTRMEIEREKEEMHKSETEKLKTQLNLATKKADEYAKMLDLKGMLGVKDKGYQLMREVDGIKYDEAISVFSVEPGEGETEDDLGPGGNIVDLFIGKIQFIEDMLAGVSDNQILDPSKMLTFATIDFYNHDTEHTPIAEGIETMYRCQISYKVTVDEYLINYMKTNTIKIEIYSSIGQEPILLGNAHIKLEELILKNRLNRDVSHVIKDIISIRSPKKNEQVATLEYRLRMRYPVCETIKWLEEKMNLDIQQRDDQADDLIATKRRRLVIVIDKAQGFPPSSNSFVYYQFLGQDFCTVSVPGANPKWDHSLAHEVIFDEEFQGIIKTQPIEFVIFDDHVPLPGLGGEQQQSQQDIIGAHRLDISALLDVEIMELKLVMLDKNRVMGYLFVKLYWLEGQGQLQKPKDEANIQKTWEQEMIGKIAQALRQRSLTMQNSFLLFDVDQDNQISFEDFIYTVQDTLMLKKTMHKDEVELLYRKLTPPPMNQGRFEEIFHNQLVTTKRGAGFGEDGDDMDYYQQQGREPNISHINKLLEQNTQQLQLNVDNKFMELWRSKILELIELTMSRKQLTIDQVIQSIDSDGNGMVSVLNLKTYFLQNGLKCKDEEIVQFLTRIDVNGDGNVDLKEFSDYLQQKTVLVDLPNGQYGFKVGRRASLIQTQESVVGSSASQIKNELLMQELVGRITDYMKQNSMSFIKLHELMDSNHDNIINSKELREFFDKKLEIKLSVEELQQLMAYFDQTMDGKIGIKEFVDAMKNSLKKKVPVNQRTQSMRRLFAGDKVEIKQDTAKLIVEYLARYMKKNNKQIASIFADIDVTQDGFISRQEMRTFVTDRLMIKDLSEEDLEDFFDYFDVSRDDRVNITEFVEVIRPELQRVDTLVSSTANVENQFVRELRERAVEFSRLHSQRLAELFNTFKFRLNFIKLNEFTQVLKSIDATYFSETEMQLLIDAIVQRTVADEINYKHFLGLGNPKYKDEMDEYDIRQSQILVKDCFGRIAKVIDDLKLDYKQAFRSFDIDGDGKITRDELMYSFQKMRIDCKPQEIDLIMYAIDKQKNNWIKIDDFVAALKENKK